MASAVDHPDHYNAHPSGVECITVVEHMTFNLGSAVKYIWRADHKDATVEDLEKAGWYIRREIERLSPRVPPATQPVTAVVVHLGDTEDHARHFNQGYAEACEQFELLLTEAREDLAVRR